MTEMDQEVDDKQKAFIGEAIKQTNNNNNPNYNKSNDNNHDNHINFKEHQLKDTANNSTHTPNNQHGKPNKDGGVQNGDDDDESDVETEKKRVRILWMFLFNACAVVISFMTFAIYTNGVIRTLERRFGLSSFQSGLLNSSNDIMHICLVVFIGYFSRKANQPRIMCVTVMFAAFAGFMMATPHFISFSDDQHSNDLAKIKMKQFDEIFANIQPTTVPVYAGLNNDSFADIANSTPVHKSVKMNEWFKRFKPNDFNIPKTLKFCKGNDNTTVTDQNCDNTRIHPAFYIFIIAQFISGVGSSGIFTLTMTYIDANAPRHKASVFIGIYMGMISLGPVAGLMLASVCLKLPENLFSKDRINPYDPTFIGCWWLGYLISGIALTVFAIPLWFYPREIRKVRRSTRPCDQDFSSQVKNFPSALKKLLTNKLYVLNLCQIICGAYTIYGMYVNLVRYIETHFHYSASVGSVVAGAVTALVGAIGGFSGGILTSKLRLRPTGALKLILTCSFLFMCGIIVLLNIHCPEVNMDMSVGNTAFENSAVNSCNQDCNCQTRRNDYYPLCGSNNISYFSPCMAGCDGHSNGTFTNCKCLRSSFMYNETSIKDNPYFEGSATPGYCTPKCVLLIPFSITLFFMSFTTSICRVPATMVTFRIVDDDERPFALGMNSFGINLLGFVPAPLIIGKLIDQCCKLWQITCGTPGACLLFDTTRLRKTIYGTTLLVEVLNFLFYFALFMLIRKLPISKIELTQRNIELEKTNDVDNDVDRKKLNAVYDASDKDQIKINGPDTDSSEFPSSRF